MQSGSLVFENRLMGAHMPVSGGLALAFDRIRSIGGTALQIFSRNQRQWSVPELDSGIITGWSDAWRAWGDYPVFIHDSYLVNLAGTDPDKVGKSVTAFREEVRRAHLLGVKFLVTHPGSHLGAGVDRGLTTYVANLDRALEENGIDDVMVLLETTAGQGTNLGSTFEELAFILEHSAFTDRLGICFDTCHVFAAGYDFRTPEGFQAIFERLDRLIGLDRIKCFHLNDSKLFNGSHKDRHEHIGLGKIGEQGFWCLLHEERFTKVPMILETPKGKNFAEDRMNLRTLKRLAGEDEMPPFV